MTVGPIQLVILSFEGDVLEINELYDWGERTPRTKIVAIGSAREIDPDRLTILFESCISEPECI